MSNKIRIPIQHTIKLEGTMTEDGIVRVHGDLKIKATGTIVGNKIDLTFIIDTCDNIREEVLLKMIENARRN